MSPPHRVPREDPARCAPAAQRRGDPLVGTAAPVARWLLVEVPGPWGRDALLESRLDPVVARLLVARARAAGVRPVAVRRPGRHPDRLPRRRHWLAVDSRQGHEGVRRGIVGADSELLDLALDGSEGEASGEPVWLVCGHSRHDPCCAVRGHLVGLELARLRPEQTWECSHLGGCRFAANVVALPEGLYYARQDSAGLPDLVAAHEAGLVQPAGLRGRSSLVAPVQAAQAHTRAVLGDLRIAAWAPRSVDRVPAGWRVVLAGGPTDGDVAVTLEERRSAPTPRLTCAGQRPEVVRELWPVRLERLPATRAS